MTKKKVKIIRCFDFGNYPGTLCFSYQFTFDELIKEMKGWKHAKEWFIGLKDDKHLIDQGNWIALSRTIRKKGDDYNKKLFYIILKDEFRFTDFEYCKLAHEVVHICQFFLPDILDRNREIEAEAYLHTHIMDQCLKALRETKKAGK